MLTHNITRLKPSELKTTILLYLMAIILKKSKRRWSRAHPDRDENSVSGAAKLLESRESCARKPGFVPVAAQGD